MAFKGQLITGGPHIVPQCEKGLAASRGTLCSEALSCLNCTSALVKGIFQLQGIK